MRYTEARLTPLAMEMLGKSTRRQSISSQLRRPWGEPTVHPAGSPNLLANGPGRGRHGNQYPMHNLRELADAVFWRWRITTPTNIGPWLRSWAG